jgi:hypothetical protein
MKRLLKLTAALGLVAALLIPAGMALAVTQTVDVDIKPASYPNPINIGHKGVLSVAILGSEVFDVIQVDPASVRLEGVAPLRWAPEDVSNDGHTDLVLKFKTQEIVAAIVAAWGDVNDGDVLLLTLTGNLKAAFGGTPIEGEDVVWIIEKG